MLLGFYLTLLTSWTSLADFRLDLHRGGKESYIFKIDQKERTAHVQWHLLDRNQLSRGISYKLARTIQANFFSLAGNLSEHQKDMNGCHNFAKLKFTDSNSKTRDGYFCLNRTKNLARLGQLLRELEILTKQNY